MREAVQWTEDERYLVAQFAYAIAGQGRYAEALTIFEGLAAAAPTDPYAARAVAAVRLRMGQPREALAALGDRGGDNATARLRLECCLRLGRRQEAQKEFALIEGRLEPAERSRYELLLESKQLPGGALDN